MSSSDSALGGVRRGRTHPISLCEGRGQGEPPIEWSCRVPCEQSLLLRGLQLQRLPVGHVHEAHLCLQLRGRNRTNAVTTEAEKVFQKRKSVKVPQERSSSPNPLQTQKKERKNSGEYSSNKRRWTGESKGSRSEDCFVFWFWMADYKPVKIIRTTELGYSSKFDYYQKTKDLQLVWFGLHRLFSLKTKAFPYLTFLLIIPILRYLPIQGLVQLLTFLRDS